MKITAIRLSRLNGEMPRRLYAVEERQVGALDVLHDYRDRTVTPPTGAELDAMVPVSEVYLEIDTDEGITGIFGPIFEDQAFQIDTRLRPHLIGRDPLASEYLWDVMDRHDRHARRGTLMMAISAVDIALWDIRGKAAGLPIYRLLGGPPRQAVPAYVSTLGYSLEPEAVVRRALQFRDEGFKAQKWFFRYGPAHGPEGMERNIALVRLLRETLGDDTDLMFDAWLGWDLPYATEMGKRMAPYHPRWLEEPVQPDRIASYAELRRATGIPIAGGEHEYTRWGFKVLLDAEGVDVVQADPDWTGGISELAKICVLASAYDRRGTPRPLDPAGLHVIASQSPAVCPMLEFLMVHNPPKQWFHTYQVRPSTAWCPCPPCRAWASHWTSRTSCPAGRFPGTSAITPVGRPTAWRRRHHRAAGRARRRPAGMTNLGGSRCHCSTSPSKNW